MEKDIIYSLKSPCRDELRVRGYRFGKGEKSVCIMGAIRGNEVQQLYICSQIINKLKELESKGAIVNNHEILVVPSVNHYAMNIDKNFWAVNNTDINRMFPGSFEGETTKRIAAGIFEQVKGYSYGIHFTSFYMPGDFIPHVRMMETGYQSASLANLFGLPYVVIRKPRPFDMATLNYNWQMTGTCGFSIYTNQTNEIDEESATQAVSAVFRFLTRMGIIHYQCHSGYIASVVQEEEMTSLYAEFAGIYRSLIKVGEEVHRGQVLAEIIHPYEGYVIDNIVSPTEGIVFFAITKPLVNQNDVSCKIIRRLHK